MYQKQRMAVFYLYKISPRGRYCQQRGYVPVVTALIRTVILYLVLIVGLRLTGKRQIGELEPIELVLTMLLSDLASVPMQNFGIPLLNGLVPIVTLLSLSMLLSWCSLHSVRFRSLVCGEPAVIIRDGHWALLARALDAAQHLIAVKALARAVLLDDDHRQALDRLIGREAPHARQALAPAADAAALVGGA